MKIIVTAQEILDKGVWEEYCDENGICHYCMAEGLMDSDEEIELTEEQAIKYNFIKPNNPLY